MKHGATFAGVQQAHAPTTKGAEVSAGGHLHRDAAGVPGSPICPQAASAAALPPAHRVQRARPPNRESLPSRRPSPWIPDTVSAPTILSPGKVSAPTISYSSDLLATTRCRGPRITAEVVTDSRQQKRGPRITADAQPQIADSQRDLGSQLMHGHG